MRKLMALILCLVCTAFLTSRKLNGAHSDHGCEGCHAPHNTGDMPGVPLWNGAETTLTFELYSSATLQAQPPQPNGASKLCLSCHDGANPDYGWMHEERIIDAEKLATTHPISFIYDSSLASSDTGLKDPQEPSGLGGTIAEDYLDPRGKVQCSSCHDVHSSGLGEMLIRGKPLQDENGHDSPALCRTCHKK